MAIRGISPAFARFRGFACFGGASSGCFGVFGAFGVFGGWFGISGWFRVFVFETAIVWRYLERRKSISHGRI